MDTSASWLIAQEMAWRRGICPWLMTCTDTQRFPKATGIWSVLPYDAFLLAQIHDIAHIPRLTVLLPLHQHATDETSKAVKINII